jgi:hypothetical protein
MQEVIDFSQFVIPAPFYNGVNSVRNSIFHLDLILDSPACLPAGVYRGMTEE